jgi:hypothetical protein
MAGQKPGRARWTGVAIIRYHDYIGALKIGVSARIRGKVLLMKRDVLETNSQRNKEVIERLSAVIYGCVYEG